MSVAVNTAAHVPLRITQFDGTAITGATTAAFSTPPTAKLLPSGAATAAVTLTEIGGGWYSADFTPSAVGTWLVSWVYDADNDGGETVRAVTAAQFDPAATLAASVVTVNAPVASDQTVRLVRGNAYLNADGRAVAWSVASPDLTGASATLTVKSYAGATVLSKAATIAGSTVRVNLTASETAALELGTPKYKYSLIATLSDGSPATLATGTVWVTD